MCFMYFIFDCFQDMEIPVLISQSFQMSGLPREALQAAELVLKQVRIEVDLISIFQSPFALNYIPLRKKNPAGPP